jgi:hypothetical protein
MHDSNFGPHQENLAQENLEVFKKPTHKRTVTVLALALVVLSIPVLLKLISSQQSVRQDAAYSRKPKPSPTPYVPFATPTPSPYVPNPSSSPLPSPSPIVIPSPSPSNGNYSISGQVFIDTNSNGIFDIGEKPYAKNATVRENKTNKSTVTNSLGTYTLVGFPKGLYQVQLVIPYGFKSTTPNPLNVSVGTDVSGVRFGIYQTL